MRDVLPRRPSGDARTGPYAEEAGRGIAAPPLCGAMWADARASDDLLAVARDFSPRVACASPGEVALDLGGVTRLFGDGHAVAEALRRSAADRGLRIRVAVAGTRTAARLLARHRPGLTVVAGEEAAALAPLPVDVLTAVAPAGTTDALTAGVVRTLQRWGIRTLGALAALPPDALAARLGHAGARWQRIARGEDLDPLVPDTVEERFEAVSDLEWPIDGLEPLSFVLGRLLEPLSGRLERRDRGAAALHVHLHLVTREVHSRSLHLPVPLREPRALRTLLLLDLESHPPAAAIDRVTVSIDPTPGPVVQYSLLTRPLPTPEQLSTLMARLQALMGETRCGAPAVVDTWEPGAFAMRPFLPRDLQAAGTSGVPDAAARIPALALRRFRPPVSARVQEDAGRPVHVVPGHRGLASGRVEACAGPWRTSGGWWADRPPRTTASPPQRVPRTGGSWDRDEWDVMLAGGVTYRLFRERDTGRWFVDGLVD